MNDAASDHRHRNTPPTVDEVIDARPADRDAINQRLLRWVVDNVQEYAIISLDSARRITSWNVGAERLLGYSADEAVGRSADMIFTEEDRNAGAPQAEAAIARNQGRAADERWHVHKDGTRFWGSGSMMPMRDDNGVLVGFAKIFRDETRAREAAAALESSRQQLLEALRENENARAEVEAAGRAKDHFLAVLSHELRTPLTPVLMAVQALELRNDIPESARAALAVIRRNVLLEARFIDDLLDLTRISRGLLDVVREPMDIHEAIGAALDICEPDIRGKKQTLDVQLVAARHRVEGDTSRLQQAVWNIVKNAAKFTPAGGRIVVRSDSDDAWFRLTVTDTGIGIEPERLPTIFDAFAQGGEWVARDYGGLGLGLAICRATVDAHGGKLEAQSAGRGHGATVVLELPLLADPRSDRTSGPTSDPTSGPTLNPT